MNCFRCSGYTELEHSLSCPHRVGPAPPVETLRWPRSDEEHAPERELDRAFDLAKALNDFETYWVEFTSTDDAEADAELIVLEDTYHSLEEIQHYCQRYN